MRSVLMEELLVSFCFVGNGCRELSRWYTLNVFTFKYNVYLNIYIC